MICLPNSRSVPQACQLAYERPTTMLLEPHPVIREMLTTAFRLSGYQAPFCLDDVPAFLHLMQTTPMWETISLIMLDLSLPQTIVEPIIDPLLMQWHTRGLVPPAVLILTTQPRVQHDAREAGYQALLKPFHLHDVFSAIHPGDDRYTGRSMKQIASSTT
jgi:DNA-binding response OmpR family regulator